jgi:hyperosmotically inducible periplasmic protein
MQLARRRAAAPARLSIDSRDLTVASAQQAMSDTWITTKVKAELLADRDAKGLAINVDTKEGVVTLDGTVADHEAIEHIKDIAARVEGVKRVETSGLSVEPSR